MPFNGSGTFSIINTFVPNSTILSSAVNQNFSDIATGLSDCLTRDGQAGMTAALKLINGTSGVPSLSATSDTATGLYFPATGVLGLVANALGLKVNSEIYAAQSATIAAGGTGYVAGDTITETGGTAIVNAVFTVSTVSAGVVTAVTATVPGIYTAKPTNPVSQGSTSGSGSGCTLTITWNDPTALDYRLAITSLADALLWTNLGSSSFVSGLMAKANGLDFATAIGASNLVQVISGSFILPPAGRLTPTTATPVIKTDVTAATRLYWTPYNGNGTPIYNGTAFNNTTSAEIFADLTAGAQASGGIYDVYKFLSSGTVTLGFSPSWSAGTSGSVTAGSCARGTSTGGTALTYLSGVPTNAVAMTVNNGATTYSVAANQGTYLGTVYINSTAGQLNCNVSYGQSRAWGIWNAYNRVPIVLQAGDGTASWTYSTNTVRPSNNSTANSLTILAGLPEEETFLTFKQKTTQAVPTGTTSNIQTGVGWNSTSAFSGTISDLADTTGGGGPTVIYGGSAVAQYQQAPALGINVVTALENTFQHAIAGTETFFGTQSNMLLSANWRG